MSKAFVQTHHSAATNWNMNELADAIVKVVSDSEELTLSSMYR